LPFNENDLFDAYIVSFGIRNFMSIKKVLKEASKNTKAWEKIYVLRIFKIRKF
jgi:ubiquinone/menaquinone biosynthesis C-methylase UbiE